MKEEPENKGSGEESSPDILLWEIRFMNRAFRIREISALGNAKLKSLIFGDHDETAVISSEFDSEKVAKYYDAMRWLFEVYVPFLKRKFDEFESIAESFDIVKGSDRVELAGLFEQHERVLEQGRLVLNDRIDDLIDRFRGIVESGNGCAIFLERRLSEIGGMSRYDESVAIWLRRKLAEWDTAGTDDRERFRQADAFLRDVTYRDAMYESYRDILRGMCRLTSSQMYESRMMMSSGKFPTVFVTGETGLSLEASSMLRDVSVLATDVDEGMQLSEGDGELFRKIIDLREYFAKTLEFVFRRGVLFSL
ncbi:MAG: hypothetical protein HGA31_05995 [Candidatus Moranbacteria bacterium]|nr:hypothetical protein [Candidatus Moranbacteria bacterium]